MQLFPTLSRSTLVPFVLCLFILLGTPRTDSYAQSPDDVAISDRWALQFQVNNNFTLGEFQGGLISAKKQYDARRAFRFGIGLNATFDQRTDEGNGGTQEQDQSFQRVTANAQWVRYPVDEGRVRAYWGVGPTLQLQRNVDDQSGTDQTQWRLGGGAVGVLGAEWFVHSHISVSAEYRAGVEYTWQRVETSNGVNRETTDSQFRIGGRGVLVGVSVYF